MPHIQISTDGTEYEVYPIDTDEQREEARAGSGWIW